MDEYPPRDIACATTLAAVKAAGEQEFPEATNVVPLAYAGAHYCEVWTGDRASTWTPTAAQVLAQVRA